MRETEGILEFLTIVNKISSTKFANDELILVLDRPEVPKCRAHF